MIDFKLSPDRATAAVLARVAAAGGKPFHEMTPEEARAAYLVNGRPADFAAVEIGQVTDTSFASGGHAIGVRVYAPGAAGGGDRPLPATLYFHGGGFVIGDLETHDRVCRKLCLEARQIVVAVDYRLAPEHPFPAAVDDAVAALDWLVGAAGEIGCDPDRLSVAGDSAGAALATYVAQVARERGQSLTAQVLFYPVTDMTMSYPSYTEFADTPPITRTVLKWFWDHYLGPHPSGAILGDPRASPIRAKSLAGCAPAFVVTAGLDPLRDEGESYARRLSQEGVETIYLCAMGTIHGFVRMGGVIPAGRDALIAAAVFIRQRSAGGGRMAD